MPTPVRIDKGSTTNNIWIGWQEPSDNGGCPITGYEIYRDDANGSEVNIQVNSLSDPLLSNNPVLRKAEIVSWEAASEHKIYRLKVRALNREGFVDSAYLNVLNAGKPLDIPTAVELLYRN
jgi:hypothetical protein